MQAQETQQTEGWETSAPPADPRLTQEQRPTHEEIVALAYALWQQRGSPEGSPEEDWFAAEQQLLARSEA